MDWGQCFVHHPDEVDNEKHKDVKYSKSFSHTKARLFTVLYFSIRSSRSSTLCYRLPSCVSVKTTPPLVLSRVSFKFSNVRRGISKRSHEKNRGLWTVYAKAKPRGKKWWGRGREEKQWEKLPTINPLRFLKFFFQACERGGLANVWCEMSWSLESIVVYGGCFFYPQFPLIII